MSDTDIIIELIKEQKDHNIAQIKAVQKNLDTGFDLLADEMRKLSEQKKIQNSRVDKLEKLTQINRWVCRNPKVALALGLAAWYFLGQFFEFFSIADILKKLI